MRKEEDRLPYVEFGSDSFWPYQSNDTFPRSGDYRPWSEFAEFMLEHGVKVERVEPVKPRIPWPEPGVYWSEKVGEVFTCDEDTLESINLLYHEDDIDDWREELLPLVLMTKTGVTID